MSNFPNWTRTVYIYTLSDPRTGDVHYVGAAVNPHARYETHLRNVDSLEKGSDKSAWLLELRAAGLMPTLTVIDNADPDDAAAVEHRHIRAHIQAGEPLTNYWWRSFKDCFLYDPSGIPVVWDVVDAVPTPAEYGRLHAEQRRISAHIQADKSG